MLIVCDNDFKMTKDKNISMMIGTFDNKDWPIKKMTRVYPRFLIENK